MRVPIPMLPHKPSAEGRLFLYRIEHIARSIVIMHTVTANTADDPQSQ